jgi:acetoin utilization deacetylase AcuC-like enzyme
VKQTTAVTAALDESTRAAAVLEETREAHDHYLATMEELRKIRDEVTRLEETDARARTLRDAAAAAGESLAALQSALAARDQQMGRKIRPPAGGRNPPGRSRPDP